MEPEERNEMMDLGLNTALSGDPSALKKLAGVE